MSQDRDKDGGTDYGGPRIKRNRRSSLRRELRLTASFLEFPTSFVLVAMVLAAGALGYSTFEISNLRSGIAEQQAQYVTASRQADRQIRELTEKVDALNSQLQSLTKDSSGLAHQIERLSSESRLLHDQLQDLSRKLEQQSPAK